jgi:PLP dependent protein
MVSTFQGRLDAVRVRIAAACARAGRSPDDVTLVAISKTFGPEEIREATEAGLTLFGENKVQEAAQKIPLCSSAVEWHLVGHLQRNKVKFVPSLFRMVHAVDSWRILEALNQACDAAGVRLPVLLEINVSGEGSKFGLPPELGQQVLEQANGLSCVEVRGLMTMPPYHPDPEAARPFFRKLRALRDEWKAATGFGLPELSMGMSGDFEVAIEEGATFVRLGTILFGPRKPRAVAPADPGEE